MASAAVTLRRPAMLSPAGTAALARPAHWTGRGLPRQVLLCRARAVPSASVTGGREETGSVSKQGNRDGMSRRRAGLEVSGAALLLAAAVALPSQAAPPPSESNCESCSNSNTSLQDGDKEFITSPSGLRYLDLRQGTGPSPAPGQTCVVDWVGYTAGYQAKRIESSKDTDEPFSFILGKGQAIAAFEEAVAGMQQGGIRRIEVPGELEEALGYSRNKNVRYTVGPIPQSFGGKRALDFVLDNQTLRDFNRTLLFDIRLSNIRN